ncbi:4-hydroxybenzoate polyprenyltransferase [Crocosphaera watsonii WH 0402]|nr:4-hydroxybenzoate polyprenyltransferase [Crocosphaera watsonii WH 0402]
MIEYIRLSSPEIPQETYGELFRENVILGFVLLAGIMVNIIL